MDWWPGLRVFFRHAPSWVTDISKEMNRIKDLEESLWMNLFDEANKSIATGSHKASEVLPPNDHSPENSKASI